MGFTVKVKVEHLELPKILVSTPSEQSGIVLIPNVEPYGTVKATVKEFIRRNLFIPDDLQMLQAPLFRKLSEKEGVEDLYKRYLCQAEVENPDLHLDEDNFVFFAREAGRSVDLDENLRLEEYHILEKTVLQLRRLPRPLSENGGRIFVETKEGILPLLGVTHQTRILDLKNALQRMTGFPVEQQLLSSFGRSMHDGLCVKDFDGPHRVCEDSILDLCLSGDSNSEQAHCRMVISVNVMGEDTFTMVVQGRDLVQSVQQVVQARSGVATWQQCVTYSGKILQEKKTLSDYYLHSESTLHVTIFRSPCKPAPKTARNVLYYTENSGMEEHKPAARKIKLLRTSKGRIVGSVTIPVLTTDTISDLKRKVRRTLQPLTERNFVLLRSPVGSGNSSNDSTPPKANTAPISKNDQFSTSGRRLSRVLSFTGRTFSGHIGNGNGVTPSSKFAAMSQQSNDGDFDALSSLPAHPEGNNGKTVARLQSLRNCSGPIISPSKQMHCLVSEPQSGGAPLFPPPLSSLSSSPSDSSVDQTIPETKMTSVKKASPVEELPLASGTPLKFVPMRPNPVPIPARSSSTATKTTSIAPDSNKVRRSHKRAASMGHLSFTPSQLHSLPVHPAPPEDHVLPQTGPISIGSKTVSPKTASPKKGNGRVKETTAGGAPEKRGLSAWFTDSMQTLKGHIKSPFAAER